MPTKKLKPWIKPNITPHNSGTLNKFGNIPAQQYAEKVFGMPVKQLAKDYSSPLFVISEKKVRDNARQLIRAFETRYPKVIHGWSYKTNYLGAVCNIMHQEGSWAEVVSEFEYEKARHNGVPGNRIIFNGPHKTRAILERAVDESARVHVDHMSEVRLLEAICKQKNTSFDVAIRMNFDTGFTDPWSRFGFNLESGEALEVARYLSNSSTLKLVGLHSHIGTFVLDPRAYSAQIEIMCNFMHNIEEILDCSIEYLDIGGGFASRNDLHGVYLPADQVVPSISQYADAICTTLINATAERVNKGKPRPTLIIETGRAVIDDAESLITSVVGTKSLPNGRPAVILDAGVNILFTAFWYNHQVRLTRPVEGYPQDTILYGPLCMNIDVIRASITLPPMEVGELLLISPVGAYNNTQWMQFIEYRPNVVMIHEGDDADKPTVSVVRAAEDLSVMVAQESVPSHLSEPFPRTSKP